MLYLHEYGSEIIFTAKDDEASGKSSIVVVVDKAFWGWCIGLLNRVQGGFLHTTHKNCERGIKDNEK